MKYPKVVLSADRTLMSSYRGISLASFFGCAPAIDNSRTKESFWYYILKNQVTPRVLFDFICNPIGHINGIANYAPYGLRKVEASLLRDGYKPEDVERTGITKVQTDEVIEAEKRGNSIKLIASCEKKRLSVKPLEVSKLDPICVSGTLNAVTFTLEYAGDQTIIGRGAGGIETASAVLRDIIEIRDHIINV